MTHAVTQRDMLTSSGLRVAALYIDPRGPYPALPGVDAWDETRDARGYPGPGPVIVHPPCGPWGLLSKLCRLQDATLAPLAVEQVRTYGGALEHPVGSRLWTACGLPAPGEGPDDFGGVTIRVEQVAWGHTCRKPTLIYLVGCDLDFVRTTIRTGGTPTHGISSKARRGALLAPSSAARRKTPLAFAEWLVAIAERALSNLAPLSIGLHLVLGQLYSRIEMRIDGALRTAAAWGPGHMVRARGLALAVRAALNVGPAAALGRLNGGAQ